MTECPTFTNLTADTVFLTTDTIAATIPDTFNRTVGTVVNVSCRSGYILSGDATFECRASGQWSYTTLPTCGRPVTTTASPPKEGLDDETKILIGAVCAVAAVIVLILLVMFIVVKKRDSSRAARNEDMRRNFMMNDSPDGRRSGRYDDDLSTIAGELYGDRYPPPPYAPPSYDRHYARSKRDSSRSQRSGPMYLPRDSRHSAYSDRNDRPGRSSRKRGESIDEEYERRGKKPYVNDWIKNSKSESELYRPRIHGRSYRDSKLWREAY